MKPNPKNEAIELIRSFINEGFLPAAARIAALVAVEYLIANERLDVGDESWWKRVKQEIENL